MNLTKSEIGLTKSDRVITSPLETNILYAAPPLKLFPFPEGLTTKIGNSSYKAFSPGEYAVLLEIYASFRWLLANYPLVVDEVLTYTALVSVLESRIETKDQEITLLKQDRTNVYSLLEKRNNECNQMDRRTKVTAFILGGTSLALAAGLVTAIVFATVK